jgi:hypothetical protein
MRSAHSTTFTLDLSAAGTDHWVETGNLRTVDEDNTFSVMNPEFGREEIYVDLDAYEPIETDAATDEEELRAIIGDGHTHLHFGPASVQISAVA